MVSPVMFVKYMRLKKCRNRRDDIDSTDLLKHLVEVTQNGAVEVAILVELEAIRERARSHLEGCILHGCKFRLDLGVVFWEVQEGGEHFEGFIVPAPEDQPPRRLGEAWNGEGDEEGQDDLEGDGESPGDSGWLEEREAKVDPVAYHHAKDDQGTFYHHHLPAAMGL